MQWAATAFELRNFDQAGGGFPGLQQCIATMHPHCRHSLI
jgi:hypothetical protein